MIPAVEVDWAAEMGIDLDLLKSEHPSHRTQIKNRKAIMEKSEKFWAWNRFVESAEPSAAVVYLNAHGADIPKHRVRVVKKPMKPAKVTNYEFTEAQLQIALRSLDAGGAV